MAEPRNDIKGWNIDTDPKNDPTYPMKRRSEKEQRGYNWERPAQQPVNVEVLHSNERPNVTAVFGTAAPPSGLSGMLRRLAFRYGEGSFAHWLPLLIADRVNVAEGVLDDLRRGHIPNIMAEKGWNATWKYNRPKAIRQTIMAAMTAAAALSWLIYANDSELRQKKRKKKEKKRGFLLKWR